MKKYLIYAMILILIVSSVLGSNIVSFQGRIGSDGDSVDTGSITVYIYDAPTAGNLVWTEIFVDAISNGYYDVVLGNNTPNPLNLVYGKRYFLDMDVNGEDIDWDEAERVEFESVFGTVGSSTINITQVQNDTGWVRAGTNVYLANTGDNVGIGTSIPSQKLDVAGGLQIDNTSVAEPGVIRWNGMDFQGFDGSVWLSLTGNSSGTFSGVINGSGVPFGAIAMFSSSCPDGWERVEALDNKFIRGAAAYGTEGGSAVHSHSLSDYNVSSSAILADYQISSSTAGHTLTVAEMPVHTHGIQASVNSPGGTYDTLMQYEPNTAPSTWINSNSAGGSSGVTQSHSHTISDYQVSSSAVLADYTVSSSTDDGSSLPPYVDVVFCRKIGADIAADQSNLSAFSVNKNDADQNINFNAWEKLAWAAADYDALSEFDLANERFIPKTDGKYLLTASAVAGGTYNFTIAIYKNGARYKEGVKFISDADIGKASSIVSTIADAQVGDYFEIYALQESGQAITVNSNSTMTYFSGARLDSDSYWGFDNGNIYNTGGNVGIGTNNPLYKLHVDGSIKADGNLSLGNGIIMYNGTSNKYVYYNGSVWQEFGTGSGSGGGGVPVGTIAVFNSTSCPDGWTEYINAQGRVIVGLNTSDSSFDILGETGGEKTHTLTDSEIPKHTHPTSTDGAHTHPATYGSAIAGSYTAVGASDVGTVTRMDSAGDHSHTANEQATGDGAHNNLQPYVALKYCIKTTDDTPIPSIVKTGNDVYVKNTSDEFGIGTISPSAKLDILGAVNDTIVKIRDGISTFVVYLGSRAGHNIATIGTTNEAQLRLMTNNSDRVVIDEAGNVGIGTDNPQAKLHVNGSIKAEGDFSLGNGIITYNDTLNKYIYYNGTDWQEFGTGSSSTGGGVPVGTIAMFNTSCPTGWERVTEFDGRFVRGNDTYGAIGGSDTHNHSSGTLAGVIHDHQLPDHKHELPFAFDSNGARYFSSTPAIYGEGSSFTSSTNTLTPSGGSYSRSYALSNDPYGTNPNTSNAGAGSLSGSTASSSNLPPYIDVVFCRKVGDDTSSGYLARSGNDLYVLNTSDEFGIGTTSPSYKLDVNGSIRATANITADAYYYSSDRNLKENIMLLENSLADVQKLEGVSFEWKSSGQPSIGLIAQDVEVIYPELVATDSEGKKSVEYGKLVAVLIEAVKEQQKQIDVLTKRVEELENK